MAADHEPIRFAGVSEAEAWYEAHHANTDRAWFVIAKKGSTLLTPTLAELLDLALAYGWIDGQVKRVDEDWYRQRWTPRRARSRWSKINRAAAERMIERGEMKPAGLREVERARADGRWDAAYDAPSTAAVPDDLRAALDGEPSASAFFETLDANNRYAILHRIQDAKKPETRARRVEKFVAMLARGETIHPPRRAAR